MQDSTDFTNLCEEVDFFDFLTVHPESVESCMNSWTDLQVNLCHHHRMCSNKSTQITCVVEYYLSDAAVNLVLRCVCKLAIQWLTRKHTTVRATLSMCEPNLYYQPTNTIVAGCLPNRHAFKTMCTCHLCIVYTHNNYTIMTQFQSVQLETSEGIVF